VVEQPDLKNHFLDCEIGKGATICSKLITSIPSVLVFNILWSEMSEKPHILAALNMIPDIMKLSDSYSLNEGVSDADYKFRGIVCYWGPHYYAYIRVEKEAGGY
jgi:hypothetical protein